MGPLLEITGGPLLVEKVFLLNGETYSYGTISRTTEERRQIMAITASQARAQLFPLIEQVNEDMKPVVITSKGGNAVLISESEYESMIETTYLLSTPANREWLLDSLAQADRGETTRMEFPIVASATPKVKTRKARQRT